MKKTSYIFDAVVLKVVDGDTVDLRVDLGFDILTNIRCRLAGIDTAETNSSDPVKRELGLKAKAFLSTLIENETVVVHSYKQDKFGRYLVDIFLNEENVNNTLLEHNLAVPYFGGKKS